ncbi:hypothetical protein VOLCADRAFT_118253, partial [Volvox carteri f. nagariensis]
SFSGVPRIREPRPSAASGSDAYSAPFNGSHRVARPDAGREPRPGGSAASALPSPSSISFVNSPSVNNDGSTTYRVTTTGRAFPSTLATTINSPVSTTSSCPIRPGSLPGQTSSGSLPSASYAESPGSLTSRISSGLAAGAPAAAGSQVLLSGTSLAQLAISSCTSAEQQLRELLEDRPVQSSYAPSPVAVAPTNSAPLPQLAATMAAATTASSSMSSMPPPLTSRRVPAASVMGSAALTASSPQLPFPLTGLGVPGRTDAQRFAVSACSSPVTSPVPPRYDSSAAGGGGGGLLAALLDHRQTLPPTHPSAAPAVSRADRVTRFAVPSTETGGGGGGAQAVGPHGYGEGTSQRNSGGGGGSRDPPLAPHAASTVEQQQLPEGPTAAAATAAGQHQEQLPSPPAPPPQQQQDQEENHETEQGKQKRAGVLWASISSTTGRESADGDPHNQHNHHHHPYQQPPAAAPAVTAAAMRAVTELKDMDEFSLVAAVRQRQQQLAQRTQAASVAAANSSKHHPHGQPSVKRFASMVGNRSVHQQGQQQSQEQLRKSLGDTSSLLGALGMVMGGHAGSHQHQHGASLPQLPAGSTRPSITLAEGGSLDAAALASGDGGGGMGDMSTASPRRPSLTSVAVLQQGAEHGGDGSGSGSFLPAVMMSPRHSTAAAPNAGHGPVFSSGSSSVRILSTSVSAVSASAAASAAAAIAAASRGSGSAPTGLSSPQHSGGELVAGPTSGSSNGSNGTAGGIYVTAAGPAAAETAEAAVRALAARFGSAVLPDARIPWDQDERDPAMRDRRKKLFEALQAANPAAYHEEAAEAAEAAYRALSERAQLRFRKLLEEPTTQEAPLRQLEGALRELTSQRPFFLPPVIVKPKVERTFVELDATRFKESSWNVDDSLFAQRKKECESHELYDTDKVRLQQLNVDWRRVVSKTRFRRLVLKTDLGVKEDGQRLDEELGEVREELQRQSDLIPSSEALQLSPSAWMAFCHDAGIVGKGCTGMDVQNIFVAVNFEEESETEESAANDDDAMVRFEFMEGLIRVAFAKFISTKRMTDASDAIGALLEGVAASPGIPPEARVDPNEWRRVRFYTAEVEEVIKEYWDLLGGIFKLYKARDRARYFWPEHFFSFLESNQLLGAATGLSRKDAKLIFAWSQALVTDELRRRQRAVSLTLWDFIEAVSRVADAISPPDSQDMVQYFLEEEEDPPETDRLVYEYYRSVGEAGPLLRRPSAGLLSAPTRPLAPKLRNLLQYLVCTLREAWGGHDVKEVAGKVMRTATFLSGGIEMGCGVCSLS